MALRRTCFDSIIAIISEQPILKLNHIERLIDEETLKNLDIIRENEVKVLLENSFVLAYHMNLSKIDIDNMTLFELENWLNLLLLEKKNEQNT